ncbi:putative transmembrane protein [Rhizoctonia solani 123E]|uniref:Putative transmembrane protein n=1 Tax=Rhizoctonia solani 123E TaxID=1423351 RepID=A0A074RWU0_9AGAM|nr:putative transmembrane protein [Rhizoctonia solani 123E]
MGMEEFNYKIAISIIGGETSWLEETENLVIGMQNTRYLALASLTFVLYDIVSTIDLESKYVWSAPWNFGRAAFHFNRLLAPMIQIVQIVSLFRFHPSPRFCVITSGIYTWGTCVIVVGVMSVLVARVWLLYFRKLWILVALLVLGILVSLPPILVILVAFKQDVHVNQNPAPDIIPGCLFSGMSKWSWIPYIGSTLYETVLFLSTIYKVYTVEYELPIINRLYRDGTYYFVVVLAANVFTMAGSRAPLISGCATGSGFLGSIMSAMCSRMLLSTKSFEAERHERIREQVMPISETIRVPRSRRNHSSTYWGIMEVDRTTLYIVNIQDRDSERGEEQRIVTESDGSQLMPLPVMYVPGGPGLRSGWVRRDSEGEVVVH